MKTLTIAVMTMFMSSNSFAEVVCTKEPVEKWKNQESFQNELKATYKIKKFKVTTGNCYEIYGWDKSGKKVEIYFNPVDGTVVKQRN